MFPLKWTVLCCRYRSEMIDHNPKQSVPCLNLEHLNTWWYFRLLYSLKASVSPSPTVSMLRLTRVSRCSFLFSLSMATVSASSGAGSSTFPSHSTCAVTTSRTSCSAACDTSQLNKWNASSTRVQLLRCRWQWSRLSSAAEGTSHSSCRSSTCRHRWRQSRRFRPGQRTGDHL